MAVYLFMYKQDAVDMIWHDAELHGFYQGVILRYGKPTFLDPFAPGRK